MVTLTKNFINLLKHEGSFHTLLNYSYFINKRGFGSWPAPDEGWQARSRTFIGWPARNRKLLKNPTSFRIPVHFFGSEKYPIYFSGSFLRLIQNTGSFLILTT
jgi:hypothetical protein